MTAGHGNNNKKDDLLHHPINQIHHSYRGFVGIQTEKSAVNNTTVSRQDFTTINYQVPGYR